MSRAAEVHTKRKAATCSESASCIDWHRDESHDGIEKTDAQNQSAFGSTKRVVLSTGDQALGLPREHTWLVTQVRSTKVKKWLFGSPLKKTLNQQSLVSDRNPLPGFWKQCSQKAHSEAVHWRSERPSPQPVIEVM
jgi:hypothetical protein